MPSAPHYVKSTLMCQLNGDIYSWHTLVLLGPQRWLKLFHECFLLKQNTLDSFDHKCLLMSRTYTAFCNDFIWIPLRCFRLRNRMIDSYFEYSNGIIHCYYNTCWPHSLLVHQLFPVYIHKTAMATLHNNIQRLDQCSQ